jgi:virginiamycin B lyase
MQRAFLIFVVAAITLGGCSNSRSVALDPSSSGARAGHGDAMSGLASSPFAFFAGPAEDVHHQMAAGPDGNVWFRDTQAKKIGYITPAGAVTEFALPPGDAMATGITAGPDGNIWYTDAYDGAVGRMTMTGAVTIFRLGADRQPVDITSGSDGNLWFTAEATSTGAWSLGRVTTSGAVTFFAVPDSNASLNGLTLGIDGNVWFANAGSAAIGRITPAGVITEFPTPSGMIPNRITPASDGGVYSAIVGGSGGLLRTSMKGAFTMYLDPKNSHPFEVISEGPRHCIWGNRVCDSGVGDCFDLYNDRRHAFSEYQFPSAIQGLAGLVAGPDGNMWFQLYNGARSVQVNGLGKHDSY